jgi:hypothetical protein
VKLNRRGTIDLPVKLMVIVLILSVSVPLLADAMERGESDNATYAMNSEVDRIFNAVAAVHYSGIGSSRTVSVNIPSGCEIAIPGGGGSDGYSVKTFFKGDQTSVRYMERPPVRFLTDGVTITGSCLLLITCEIIDGISGVRVDFA